MEWCSCDERVVELLVYSKNKSFREKKCYAWIIFDIVICPNEPLILKELPKFKVYAPMV